MTVQKDFPIHRYVDLVVRIELRPPIGIGGKSVQMIVSDRFGSVSPHFVKSTASGYDGVSGLRVVDAGQGVLEATIDSVDTSGLAYGNYAYEVKDVTSGSVTPLVQGYLILKPSMG